MQVHYDYSLIQNKKKLLQHTQRYKYAARYVGIQGLLIVNSQNMMLQKAKMSRSLIPLSGEVVGVTVLILSG